MDGAHPDVISVAEFSAFTPMPTPMCLRCYGVGVPVPLDSDRVLIAGRGGWNQAEGLILCDMPPQDMARLRDALAGLPVMRG